MNLKKLWRDYNLGIVLFLLFAASWLLHGVFNWFYVMNEAVQHGQPFQVSEFWIDFMNGTFENWQSEFLQLFSMVVLTSFLVYKGSAESRDSQDQMQASLTRIENQLKQLEKTR